MSASDERVPSCPVSGRPAVRRVQWVTTRLLTDLWRVGFGVDVGGHFAGLERIGLWESPTGLYFFDPPREGDNAFYASVYGKLKSRGLFTENTLREEFRLAAAHVPAGARVLDVGCGHGAFQRCVPHAQYTGLDPNFAEKSRVAGVRNESLAQHLTTHAGVYDAVCCFQVIEHVSDPAALFAGLVAAARPGGLILVGVPHIPSAMARIPNFLINAPPHHLTWWTKASLRALAATAGATVESVEAVPWGKGDAAVYWMERLSPIKCADEHYRGSAAWHAASLIGALLGAAAGWAIGPPRPATDEGAGLLLIARRAGRS